jgi:hypothetical protein
MGCLRLGTWAQYQPSSTPAATFEKNRAGVFGPPGVVIPNGSLKSRSTRTMDGET